MHTVQRSTAAKQRTTTMEDFFAPTTRLRDLFDPELERDSINEDAMSSLVELELITGSSAEDIFLHRGFSWSDYYSFAQGKLVWMSPDIFFGLNGIDSDTFQWDYRSFLTVRIVPNDEDTSQEPEFLCVSASSEAHATIAADILLQFLTTCESHKVELSHYPRSDRFPVSGLAFSHFLEQSRNLRVLCMSRLSLNTCHCRAIDALTRTDLQIELDRCEPTESGQEILLECIRQNRGPTKLSECRIDTRRLADAMRGNNSVTTLRLHFRCSDEDKLYAMQALAENEGLVTLDLESARIADEIWVALWQSVAHHPKLEKISLPRYVSTWRDGNKEAQKILRMQVMVDALRVNTVLHTIALRRVDFDEDILDSTVYPLLLANKYRPRVGAIAEVEGLLRCKLLGWALGSISSNPSLIWMFLSGNANVRLGPIPRKRKRAPNSDEEHGPRMN
jgi:hypothetical protein